MLIYEVVAIIAAILSAGVLGALLVLRTNVKDSIVDMGIYCKRLDSKVAEFDEITKKASEANNSLGTMLADLENKVLNVDERLSMLQAGSSATSFGVENSWKAQSQKRPSGM